MAVAEHPLAPAPGSVGPDPVRVLLVIKCLDRGGAEMLLLNYVQELQAGAAGQGRPIEVELAVVRSDMRSLAAEFERLGVPVHDLGARSDLDPRWLLRLRRLLSRGGFHVVHSHLPISAAGGRIAARSLGRRRPALFYTEHSMHGANSRLTRATRWLTGWLDDRVIAVSQTNRAALPAPMRRRAEVLRHGVVASRVRTSRSRGSVFADLDLDPSLPTYVCVANLTTQKRQDVLIDAVARLRDEGRAVQVLLAGDGPLRAELAERITHARLDGSVRLLGARSDVFDLMNAADAVVLCSDWECLPVTAMEALTLGVPMVVTAVGDLPLLVTDDVNGLVIEPGSVPALAGALARISDPRTRRRLANGAHAVRDDFGAGPSTRVLSEGYREAAAALPHQPRPQAPRTGAADDRPMVLHLTTTPISLTLLLGPQLARFGAEGYRVVTASADGPEVADLRAAGIEHHVIRNATRASSPLRDLRAWLEIARLIRRLRPDVLHTHNPKPGVMGRIAGRLCGVPVVVNTVHGLYAQPEDPWRRRLAVYTAERIAASFSHLELIQSVEDLDTLRRLRIPADRLRLLGNGVDLSRFDPSRVDPGVRLTRRAEFGISPSAFVVVVVARLVWEKGFADVFAAASRLAAARGAQDRPITWLVVGPDEPGKADGVDRATIERAAAAGVVFAGFRSDMPELYAAGDAFVLASRREGFPRAAMEASAMGLPVVATDVRGCRQVVDDGVTGYLFTPGDVGALAAQVARLADDPEQARALGRAARSRAAEEFDDRRVARITLDAYAERLDPDGRHRR